MKAWISKPGQVAHVTVDISAHKTPAALETFWRTIDTELRAGRDITIPRRGTFQNFKHQLKTPLAV